MSDKHATESNTRSSRRSFIANSAALAGASLTAGMVVPRSLHAAGSDVLRIGLIGCGGRGAGAVKSALTAIPQAQLTGLADPFADRAERAMGLLAKAVGDRSVVGENQCFSGLDSYKQLIDSGIDVAILAEPPHFRPIHIEACIDSGVHVFAEKPMGVDAPGVRRVLASGEKARQKNLSLVSGFETRYKDSTREAIARIRDGQLGEILTIQTTYNTGSLWHRGREPDWTEMQFQLRNWYYFTWLSGDHIVEQHVHFNDLACWVMNDEPPLDAWGYGGRQVRTDSKFGDIFDHHAVVYTYPQGTRMYAFTRQQPGCYMENSVTVVGSKATLRSLRTGLEIVDSRGNILWKGEKQTQHPEITSFKEMVAGITEGKPINQSLSMARSTMHAILGRMATHSGQKVTWDDALASKIELAPQRYTEDADPPVLPDQDGAYPIPMPGVSKVV